MDAQFWLNLQMAYDLHEALQSDEAVEIGKVQPVLPSRPSTEHPAGS